MANCNEPDAELARRTITIRRTRNPYAREPEYIAYSKVTLDYRGWLDMSNLGLGEWERYLVAMRPGGHCELCGGMQTREGAFLPSWAVREALEGGGGEAITVVETSKDCYYAARCYAATKEEEKRERIREECERRREKYERIWEQYERDIAFWKDVFGKVWAPFARCTRRGAHSSTTAPQMEYSKISEGRNGAEDDDDVSL